MHNSLDGKTVLVTGATGLIGSNLCNELLKNPGIKVVALSRSREKLERVFGKYRLNTNFSYHAQDICSSLDLSERIDCIFHAAGFTGGTAISDRPVDIILSNFDGLKNCLNFLIQQEETSGVKGRILVFSSATVYTNDTGKDRKVTEDDTESFTKISTQNAPYTESKRMCEVLAAAYRKQYGIDSVIARIGYVYGYCPEPPSTAFYNFMKTALQGEDIYIKNPVTARRDNIYIDDVIAGLLAVIACGQSGEAYNISSAGEKGNFAAIDEMSMILTEIINQKGLLGKKAKVSTSASVKARESGLILANDKLKGLGWELRYNLDEGIEQTVNAYLREYGTL